MFATALMDVEDILDPAADDVTLAAAETLRLAGLRATFCVVGERARQWKERGRTDVVRALAWHDIGYHTNFHSLHPTIAEYLANLDWEAGVAETLRRETPGVQALEDAFGRSPSCYGGPGNTWGPQVNEAMLRLGVPAVVYAHSRVPGGDLHRYCGAIMYPDGGAAMRDDRYGEPGALKNDLDGMCGALQSMAASGVQWNQAFLGHPSRMQHEAFWDGPGYSRGENPVPAAAPTPARRSAARLEAALADLSATARALAGLQGVTMTTIDSMNSCVATAEETPLSEAEAAAAASELDGNLRAMAGWVIHSPSLDLTRLRSVARQKIGTLRRITLSQGVQ